MNWRAIAALVGLGVAGGLVVVGAIVVFSALVSPRTGTVSATDGTCDTALAEPASAGDTGITVYDLTESCAGDMWIVISEGWSTQECVQVQDPSGPDLYLYSPLQYDHAVGETIVGVSECPATPTPTPTWAPPSPTPESGCGTYGDLQPWPSAAINLAPDSGPAGSPFEVELGNVEPNPDADQPAEVLWDWNPEEVAGELIGSGVVPRDEPATLLEATAPDDAEPGEHSVAACWWYSLNETWYYKEATFSVAEPTPTPLPTFTPTPTPTPAEGQMRHCPQAGRWAIAAWEGPDGVDAGEALATCGEGAVDAAYALDPSTGEWLRWFRDRPEINTLSTVENMQGLITRGSPTASPIPAVEPALPEPGQMRGCPLPGRWAIAVWEGPDGTEASAALDTCGVWQADVAYWLDPETGGWERWFRERPEISTLPYLPVLGTVIVLGGGKPSDLIAFSSDRDGNGEIYVMNEDGTKQTRITNNPANDQSPAWSPDGTKIAFASDRSGEFEIYTMSPNGTFISNVTNNPSCDGYDPAWSPDGFKLAYARQCPTSGSSAIMAIFANGTGLTYLNSGYCEKRHPTWSPDGSWVAYQVRCGGTSSDWNIYKIKAGGSSSLTSLATGPGNDQYPDWSPDGTRIAYSSDQDGDYEIYTVNPGGTGQTYFFDHPAMDLDPSWSANGSKIAFISDRDFPFQIYVMKADGTGLTRLKSNAADTFPDWR